MHVILPLVASALLAAPLRAQPAQWGTLERGPHAVGFRVIESRDLTRRYFHHGEGDAAARPMQLAIWYPARAGGRAMPWADYVYLAATAQGPRPLDAALRREAESFLGGPLSQYLGNPAPDSALRRVLATPTAARRDAPAAAGRFPLVLTIALNPGVEQSVRWEYLASHGYVVVGIAWLGTAPHSFQRGEWSATAVQAQAEDVGFAFAAAAALPYVDRDRAAWVGALTAGGLMFQMRSGRLRALATADGFLPADMRVVPGFDLARFTIPLLEIRSSDAMTSPSNLLDSLRFAERFFGQFERAGHLDSYQFARIAHPERAAAQQSYETAVRLIRRFLDATVRADSAELAALRREAQAGASPDGDLRLRWTAARAPVPTEGEFLMLLRQRGIAEARRLYDEVRAREPDHQLFTVQSMISASRFLVRDRGPEEATAAHQLLVDAWPRSVAAREAQGDWYVQGRVFAGARAIYEAALALVPDDPSLSPAERVLRERGLRDKLARLPAN